MMLHWLQQTGSKPIALMGGGTTQINLGALLPKRAHLVGTVAQLSTSRQGYIVGAYQVCAPAVPSGVTSRDHW